MLLKDILILVAYCDTYINLVDINGKTIWYRKKKEFNETYNLCNVEYIHPYNDVLSNEIALEIGIDFEVY